MATDDDTADGCIAGDSSKDERGITLAQVTLPRLRKGRTDSHAS